MWHAPPECGRGHSRGSRRRPTLRGVNAPRGQPLFLAFGGASIQGNERTDLDRERAVNLAVVRLLKIVGEAAARLTPELWDRQPEVPWPLIVGPRNRECRIFVLGRPWCHHARRRRGLRKRGFLSRPPGVECIRAGIRHALEASPGSVP